MKSKPQTTQEAIEQLNAAVEDLLTQMGIFKLMDWLCRQLRKEGM